MRRSLIILAVILLVPIFSAPAFSHAQEEDNSSPSLEEVREILKDRIEDLKLQVAMLIERLIDMRQARFEKEAFPRTLTIGDTGEDVRTLQEFLANYTQFYPEGLVTGYFGPLTLKAVERFKAEYNIIEAGVGQRTREALGELFASRDTFAVSIPAKYLPFRGAEEGGDEEDEFDLELIAREIHEEVNRVREQEGLDELTWDDELAEVALLHSQDQARDNKYLTAEDNVCQYPLIRHEGFEAGLSVRDRVESADISYSSVGENIAMIPLVESRTYSYSGEEPECPEKILIAVDSESDEGEYREDLEKLEEAVQEVGSVNFIKRVFHERDQIVDLTVEGWMESPGHRENIVFDDYTHGGIGIARMNNYLIITHNFIGK